MIDLKQFHVFDGGLGTMLQAAGLKTGHHPEKLNLSNPDELSAIHTAYAAAGSDIISANTFGASRRKMGEDPRPYIEAGIRLAKKAAAPYGAYVALDVGPLGALMEPYGELTFREAYESFAEVMTTGAQAGADLVLIETMSDLLEAKAALLAAKEHTDLPVFVTMTFGEDGKTFIGTDPAAAAVTLTALGADAIGVNCSLGPDALVPTVNELLAATHLPIIVQPNAGLPKLVDGKTVFDVGADEFADWAGRFIDSGVSILGGCCGTTPAHIGAIRRLLNGRSPVERKVEKRCCLCGWQKTVTFADNTIKTVGELLNPTGRAALTEALRSGNWEYIAELAISQQEDGADFLVINAGLPDIDQAEVLPQMVLAVQKVSPLPLVIDCGDPVALEKALRICRGRPILNSVNGSEESLRDILPLAVKYGTGLIVLAMDETGISHNACGRRDAALRVARKAEASGVDRSDIFVDCLALAASVDQNEIMITPEAVRLAREAGYKSVLGISNVSYGLPVRDPLNCAFLSACLAAGLNLAIVNVGSERVRETLDAGKVLMGLDENCAEYIHRYSDSSIADEEKKTTALKSLIISGRKSEVPAAAEKLLKTMDPIDIINDQIIPALDEVGGAYECGDLFLPQLMVSAEAVKLAFGVLDKHLPSGASEKGTIILATVRGDIHDIGKNIVRMLLENYGYRVIDLGRDVSEDAIVKAALESGAKLVGLSALMTTTALNMVTTIEALRDAGADCRIMVGGAVVTQEFADKIGADYYAKDAAQSAKIAAEVFG